jgi:glutamate 5-kinase
MTDLIEKAKRIVIKVGSSLMVNQDKGDLREEWLKSLVEDIANLRLKNKEVVIVTSGSVALGRKYITSAKRTFKLEEKQAAAACGQPELVRKYQEFLGKKNIPVAQILLTMVDSENRRNYLNAKSTLETLLSNNIVPVINENDTVATEELRFGDNDRLAARVAQMISADLLILFSDVDGLYTGNPRLDKLAKHIPQVKEITKHIEDMASGPLSNGIGSGGMVTKIEAAKIAVSGGCNMILALGKEKYPVRGLEQGDKHTVFLTKETPYKARKRWIASSLNILGDVVIDDGAVIALKGGRSLLPAGVIDIKGKFDRGDTVMVKDSRGNKIAIGLCAYTSEDAWLIMGQQSQEIENMVGFSGRNELIHRDNLVVLEGGGGD